MALEPDLVLAAGNFFTPPADIARMRELGYPVVVVYAQTVDEVLDDIELIGDALGEGAAARDLTAGMQADIDQVTAAVADSGPGRARSTRSARSRRSTRRPPARSSRTWCRWRAASRSPPRTPTCSRSPSSSSSRPTPRSSWSGMRSTASAPRTSSAGPGWGVMTAVRNGDVRASR